MRSRWLTICLSALLVTNAFGAAQAEKEEWSVGKDQSLMIDREKRVVRFKGWITTLKDSDHCGIGWSGGSHGSESGSTRFLLETKIKPEEVYEALIAVGKRPGNNLSWWKRSTPVGGDPILIKVSWPGSDRPYDLGELVQDDRGASLQIRFGGNLKTAQKRKTGCITCFSSCYVGITSNAKIVLSERKKHHFRFTRLAPPPGTEVEFSFQ